MNSRVTTSMTQRNVLSDLNNLTAKLAKTQAQAASGKQITRPSDDPYGASRAMSLRTSMSANTQYQSNIDDAKGWQDTTETSLSSINEYYQRAHDLLIEGASDTEDATSRTAIASEIDQIIDGMKEAANATYAGSFVMSGTSTAVAPYTVGTTDDTYKGDDNGSDPSQPGVLREIGPGVTVSINTTAREVLGDGQSSGDGKMLDMLRNISDHLKANDGDALKADIGDADKNLDTLLSARARNGALSNRMDAASERLDDIQQALTKQLSDTEDADFTKTMIDFNSQSTAYQAALRAGANIVQSSLMDFLH
jgi:flagellar hook-associated protein 3 FlgL